MYSSRPIITERIVAEAINWPAVNPINGRIMVIAVNNPEILPYLLLKYSGTVLPRWL